MLAVSTRLLAVDLLLEDIELRARPTTGPEKSAIDDVDERIAVDGGTLTELAQRCANGFKIDRF